MYKSVIKKGEEKHDKIIFVARTKLSTREVLISKALIDSESSYEDLFSMNDVLKQYSGMKDSIKILRIIIQEIYKYDINNEMA